MQFQKQLCLFRNFFSKNRESKKNYIKNNEFIASNSLHSRLLLAWNVAFVEMRNCEIAVCVCVNERMRVMLLFEYQCYIVNSRKMMVNALSFYTCLCLVCTHTNHITYRFIMFR